MKKEYPLAGLALFPSQAQNRSRKGTPMFRKISPLLLLLAVAFVPRPQWAQVQSVDPESQDRVGVVAPAFNLQHWVNSAPLEINNLRGKVVLVRWWTDTCDLCAATAPALRKLQAEYGSRGFQVIGMFHPKPAGDWNVQRVERAATRLNFNFPIGLDGDWNTLKRWLPDPTARNYTSVSFIVDKHGVIRYVHPGGEFHESDGSPAHAVCERDFRKIEAVIVGLLAEK